MTSKKNESKAMCLTVTEGLTVTILPDSTHEFLIPTRDVAAGYGVSPGTIRRHAQEHGAELVDGKHFIRTVQIMNGAPTGGATRTTMWTKRGVVRLGFFIKSERAKLFRDWAEDLVLSVVGHRQPTLPEVTTRRMNRLTPDRIIDIMSDVCLIDDKVLRERIVTKIKGGYNYGN